MVPSDNFPLIGGGEVKFSHETHITWQHAFQYVEKINNLTTWVNHPVVVKILETECLLSMRWGLPIRHIRDWVFDEVKHQYEMHAMFNIEGLLVKKIPDAIRFTFDDSDTAFLFNIAWR